jgi:uracil-DNA glycosylase family protein
MIRSAAKYLPESRSLKRLREAARGCRGCDLYKRATQTVFGEGKTRAKLMFVGEQPGNSEDLQGHPFVGPAGALLRKAMEQAGIEPKDVYITNAVKHFKFIERGKKRIHQKPKTIEIQACEPWLEAEIELVRPQLVVALGATAAQTFLGSSFRLTKHRGEVLRSPLAPRVTATVHPSSILRSPDDKTRRRELAKFVADLQAIERLTAT